MPSDSLAQLRTQLTGSMCKTLTRVLLESLTIDDVEAELQELVFRKARLEHFLKMLRENPPPLCPQCGKRHVLARIDSPNEGSRFGVDELVRMLIGKSGANVG